MTKIFFRFIFLSIAVWAADYFVAGIHIDNIATVIIAGAILTFVHTIIKPIVKILTLPLTLITLGLFSLILNAAFFWFVSGLVPGMEVDNFVAAILGSLIVSFLNWVAGRFGKKEE